MEQKLKIYNTLKRKKQKFEPINPPFVGLYVCGPTVYGDAHLGHARPAVIFDLLYRYLKYLGYKVRYVRNLTDVGHLENDADEGEDKIAKKARLEELEPMEIAQRYINAYHKNMRQLNTIEPNIEPQASGHIPEQIKMVEQILEQGFAYEKNGSVYFDVEKYSEKYDYGKLSGRVVEDLKSNTRDLQGQTEKKNPFDFALWKKAEPEHIMRWDSEWSNGFPGWHLECSVMSTKYLGEQFDIHGGGLDLQFPHHECEIAQSTAATGNEAVKYWMHNNMITIDGQKMSKSLGNFIKLDEMFSGEHKLLEQAFNPQVVRFFMLQAHYRKPLDFSNKALKASEKGLNRLMEAMRVLEKLEPGKRSTVDISGIKEKCFTALNDDLNTPILIAHLFDGVKIINSVKAGKEALSKDDLTNLRALYSDLVYDVLGLTPEEEKANTQGNTEQLMQLLLKLRAKAKKNKDFETADAIRNELNELGINVKDTPDGAEWSMD
ncbi:MAG: cysteine--tRNA ligase [Bacteroidota bacterium]|nr:cysteine--tRNA ligase [Bacteroidota bacterium]